MRSLEWSARHEIHDQRGRVRVVDQPARLDDRRVVDRTQGRRLALQPRPGDRVGHDMGWRRLIATISPVHSSLARQTVAIPPDRMPVEQECSDRRSASRPSAECIMPDADRRRPATRAGVARAIPEAGRRWVGRRYVSIERPDDDRRPSALVTASQEVPVDRFEPNLRIPGPTALPPSVREAGARQMINHRGPEFAAMLDRILDRHEAVFRHDRATSR